MRNKLAFKILEKINQVFGDFEIGQVWGGDNDVYLRFGYWNRIDITKLNEILGHLNTAVEEEYYDDDCGYKYSYHLK